MAIPILGIGLMTCRVVMGSTNSEMGPGTKESSKMQNLMEKVRFIIKLWKKMTLLSTLVNGKIMFQMVRVRLSIKTMIDLMDSSSMV